MSCVKFIFTPTKNIHIDHINGHKEHLHALISMDAVSIGESQVEAIRQYIRNQETHHQKKTFQQE